MDENYDALRYRWSRLVEPTHVSWTWDILTKLYGEPHRAYHTLSHVGACIERIDLNLCNVLGSRAALDTVELALFFHDAVYVPADKRNEELSAGLLRALGPIVVRGEGRVERACVAILATRNHDAVVDDEIAQFVVDIDLSILGEELLVYDRYAGSIRKEYAAVSDDAWRVGRSGFLAEMLARKRIFQTEWGRKQFEASARRNMQQELHALEK